VTRIALAAAALAAVASILLVCERLRRCRDLSAHDRWVISDRSPFVPHSDDDYDLFRVCDPRCDELQAWATKGLA